MYTALVIASIALLINIDVSSSVFLRTTVSFESDPCFQRHLDDCASCIVDGSGLCGYCHTGRHGGKCARVVGDAHKPDFRCSEWTKPNLAGAPTTCKSSRTERVRVVASPAVHHELGDKKMNALPANGVVDRPIPAKTQLTKHLYKTASEPNNTVSERKKTISEPKKKSTRKAKTKTKTKTKTGTRKTNSIMAGSPGESSRAPPPMTRSEMKQEMDDIVRDLSVGSEIMEHQRVEWDKAHQEEDDKTKDSRNIDWEEIKKHNELSNEKRAALHYKQKEENENVQKLLQKRTIAENTLKHRIANRDIIMTEHAAVNHHVNSEDILDKTTRPDHIQFNKYLNAKDKEFNQIIGSTGFGSKGNYARMNVEHTRYKANEVDDDDTTPIGMGRKELNQVVNSYNDMAGHLTSNSYKKSIDPKEHNIGQKGYW
jgi:hypothetical protein